VTANLRTELESTPRGRLCLAARQVVEAVHERINKDRRPEQQDPYPYTPSVSDFEELLGPDVDRELELCAFTAARDEIGKALGDEAQRAARNLYLTMRALHLQKEIDRVKAEIANKGAA
jgi:hypothetical protein